MSDEEWTQYQEQQYKKGFEAYPLQSNKPTNLTGEIAWSQGWLDAAKQFGNLKNRPPADPEDFDGIVNNNLQT